MGNYFFECQQKKIPKMVVEQKRQENIMVCMLEKNKKNPIYAMRVQKKMTQKDVAEAIGASVQQISKLENGERKLAPEWLERLSKALNCSKGELLGEEGVSEEEREILDMYKNLTPEKKQAVKAMLKALSGKV